MSVWTKAVGKAYKQLKRDGVIPQGEFVPMNRGRAGKAWYKRAKELYNKMN